MPKKVVESKILHNVAYNSFINPHSIEIIFVPNGYMCGEPENFLQEHLRYVRGCNITVWLRNDPGARGLHANISWYGDGTKGEEYTIERLNNFIKAIKAAKDIYTPIMFQIEAGKTFEEIVEWLKRVHQVEFGELFERISALQPGLLETLD